MNAYLVYNTEYNVLICKSHQHAIAPKYITRHFLKEHDVSFTVRQNIHEFAEQFFSRVKKAEDLEYTEGKIQPIPYLRIVDGFQCQYDTCGKIQGTLDSVKKHCWAEHNWKSKDGDRWLETRAQTFYQGNSQR